MNRLLFIITFLTLVFFPSCRKQVLPRSQTVMDTVCTVNAFDDGTENLYDRIFERLAEIENTFSATRQDSELSAINSQAGFSPVKAGKDFIRVLNCAMKVSEISGGAFTPLAGSLIDLWGINTDHARVPEPEEISDAIRLMNLDDIEISGEYVFLKNPGMKLNLGAIVKGFAADEICVILKAYNVKKAVIDLGGNIYVYGEKEDGEKWTVGIKDPEFPGGNPLLKLLTEEKSVVTSGVYERYFESGGKRYHHIFNPKTGYPAESGIVSSTVLSDSSMTADALSTATFVLGVEASFSLLNEFKKELSDDDISFIFICGYGSVFASSELNGNLSFVQDAEKEIIFIP